LRAQIVTKIKMRKASLQNLLHKFIYRFVPLIAGMLCSLSAKSQDFNYSFAKDSVAWQELNSQTILNADNSAWEFCYKIPIGFSFNYLGRSFDSLRIETNGYLVFDEDRNYALTAFLGFGDCVDADNNHAVLGYAVSGTNGNRVLKIQFKNTSTALTSPKHFTYQVWLKENSAVEIHIGPNDFQPSMIISSDSTWVESVLLDEFSHSTDSLVRIRDTAFVNTNSLHAYRIGLINMNMDAEINGLFAGGTIASPQSQPVNTNTREPVYFLCAPSQGTRYSFTPNF
jgi:hypothetical protein